MTVSRRASPVAVWVAGAVALATSAGTAALALANQSAIHALTDAHLIEILLPLSFGFMGLLITSRVRRNVIGWIFLAVAIATGVPGMAAEYTIHSFVVQPGSWPGGVWAAWLTNWVTGLVYPAGLVAFLMLLFPNGRLISPRWRIVAAIAIVDTVLMTVLAMLEPNLQATDGAPVYPNPIGVPALGGDALGPVWFVGFLVGLLALLASAISLFVRLRRSRGDERQQVKWFAYAVVATVVLNAAVTIAGLVQPQMGWWWSTLTVLLGFGIAIPASAALAILKYRLYDIDLVISRTLVYGALAAFIAAVYVGIVVGIGTLVGSAGQPNLLLSIVATAIVAVAFQPVRERLQKIANRLVYGKRATPYEVLSQFSERVAETYGAEETLPKMARVLAEGTGADRARVWLRTGTVLRPAAAWPEAAGAAEEPVPLVGDTLPDLPGEEAVPVRHQGELLGALTVTKRPGESLTPIERKLLDDLAHQAGLVFKNVGLTAELLARLEDLRASRQRLVAAQDDERRKLERNLHDGAQQNLVAIKVKLGLAEMMSAKDPEKARELISSLKTDTDEALETLRDLARGIYPPLLADKGLVAALESQARKATVPVTVEGDGVGRYPQEIEAAVYFCVLEALQNVQKYAGATSAAVRLSDVGCQLHFQVHDDGAGFDQGSVVKGAGLTNMDDRLDALGGDLSITSEVGRFTQVSGSIPIPAVEAAG